MKKALIFIVSYNAESFIQQVLDRIPDKVLDNPDYDCDILIIDDKSSDKTFEKAYEYLRNKKRFDKKLKVYFNPINQGYGGNQKLGYTYAIQNNYDAVVLLHGDGQYAPELLDEMIQPLLTEEADVVFGSRMLNKMDALKGKMPLYKWIGNQILTKLQNRLLNANLAEFHTGYRAYSIPTLKSIPFQKNSDYYDFDTDIIIQVLDTQKRIKEIPIPTYYGEEISYVNGMKYAWLITKTTILSRLMQFEIMYDPKFDYEFENVHYKLKLGFTSSHQLALDRLKPSMKVLDIASGPGFMTKEIKKIGCSLTSLDKYIQPQVVEYSDKVIKADLDNYQWNPEDLKVDVIFLLDIIEHLKSPETFLTNIRNACTNKQVPEMMITTPNIAFIFIRLGLFLGWFNYGKKGILDKDHCRLFTFKTLKNLVHQSGYLVKEVRGIPAPFPLAVKNKFISRLLLNINKGLIWLSKGLFSYQICMVIQPKPTVKYLLNLAKTESKIRANKIATPSLHDSI